MLLIGHKVIHTHTHTHPTRERENIIIYTRTHMVPGGELFLKTFVRRACDLAEVKYADKLARLECMNLFALESYRRGNIRPEGWCTSCCCPIPEQQQPGLLKCIKCKNTVNCGRRWCELSPVCVECRRSLCAKCALPCTQCTANVCEDCVIGCAFCPTKLCRGHWTACKTCTRGVYCQCRAHVCSQP